MAPFASEWLAVLGRLALLAIVAVGAWRLAVTSGFGPALRRLFFVRHQVVLGAALFGAAFAFLGPLRAMMGNALVLTRAVEVWWITFLAVSAAWVVMSTWYITDRYGPVRFADAEAVPDAAEGVGPIVATPNRRLALTAALSAPLVLGVVLSTAQHDALHVTGAGIAGAAGWLLGARGLTIVLAAVIGILAAGLQLYINAVLRDVIRAEDDPVPSFALYRDVPGSFLGKAVARVDRRLFGGRLHAAWQSAHRTLVGLLRALARPLRPRRALDRLETRVGSRLAMLDRLGPGYLTLGAVPPAAADDGRTARRHLMPGHAFALVQIGLLFALYVFVYYRYHPLGGASERFPVLGFALILFMILAYVLSAAAFLLDRWRISPVLLATVIIGLLWTISYSDHYFPLQPYNVATGGPHDLDPDTAIRAWYTPDDAACGPATAMIAVATSGGGIRAAAWTAEVLTGLEEAFGARFTRALSVVSSVSGGSVGSAHYLLGFPECGARDAGTLAAVRRGASAASLRNIAWGFVYPDLLRTACAPCMEWLPGQRVRDRAWAMEREWGRHVVGAPAETTLGDWRTGVRRGVRPVALINATTVDSGHTFVFSPVDLQARDGAFEGFATFNEEYPALDVRVLTAARLSATFPYVSPVARPVWSGPPAIGTDGRYRTFHLADGGYVDNFGIATVVEWLGATLDSYAEVADATEDKPANVLLIQIRDSELSNVDDARPTGKDGLSFAAMGPIQTVINARGATQIMRNDQEVRLFRGIRDIHAWELALSGEQADAGDGEGAEPPASRASDGEPAPVPLGSAPDAPSPAQAEAYAVQEQLARAAQVAEDLASARAPSESLPVNVASVAIELPNSVSSSVSLSWKLTEIEIANLRGAWCGLFAAWQPTVPGPVENIRAFLGVPVADVVVPEACRSIVARPGDGAAYDAPSAVP